MNDSQNVALSANLLIDPRQKLQTAAMMHSQYFVKGESHPWKILLFHYFARHNALVRSQLLSFWSNLKI